MQLLIVTVEGNAGQTLRKSFRDIRARVKTQNRVAGSIQDILIAGTTRSLGANPFENSTGETESSLTNPSHASRVFRFRKGVIESGSALQHTGKLDAQRKAQGFEGLTPFSSVESDKIFRKLVGYWLRGAE